MTTLTCKELEQRLDLGLERCWKLPAGKARDRMEEAWCKLLEEYKDQYAWEQTVGTG
jgi:hypothetical protein